MRYFITGGAGFIGSHIAEKLLRQSSDVTVYDNFSTGRKDFFGTQLDNPLLKVVEGDVLDSNYLISVMRDHDMVFHLQANADVRNGPKNTGIDLEQNVIGTWNVLEAMRINRIKKIAFSSSATVYGEPEIFPTPEDSPLIQTSLYGASKLSGEAMIQAYSEYYDIQNWIFRFVSWIGERYTHGVIFDFVKKLSEDASKLKILGNGQQEKSYLYVKDGVEGIIASVNEFTDQKNVINLGHEESLRVDNVANIIVDEMGLKDVRYDYVGGSRGWKGDSPLVKLDITKIRSAGWTPKISIEEGIRRTVKYLLENKTLLKRRD